MVFGQVRECVFMMMAVLPQCLVVPNHIYDMFRSLCVLSLWVCLRLSLKLCWAVSVMLTTEMTVRFLAVYLDLAVRVHSHV